MLIDDLIEQALSLGQGKKVQDVRAGLGYTGLMYESGECGLAYTFRNELGDGCGTLGQAGTLVGMDAEEIILWAKEKHRLKAAIGLAAINALLNDPAKGWDTGNVMSAFDLNEQESFGMVGEFNPILKHVKGMTKHIYVFEQNVPEGSDLLSSEDIPQYLPLCDVVVLTATSIINHSFDEVSSYCKNAKEVCLVGPSTPLCPDVFRKYNITLLAGSVVKEPERALEIISQGGGTMALKQATCQVLQRI